MAQIIGLPKLSPTMEEGVLVRWTKKEGDKVSPGDLVAEVETDKANMDFNIEDEGTILKLLAKEGDTVKLGAPVLIIGKPGEDVAGLLAKKPSAPEALRKQPTTKPPAPASVQTGPAPLAEARSPKPEAPPAPPPAGRLLASPLAKTLAIELGIDLRTLKGSG